ncbi:MAG: retroviral-like aspartic protease family protein [gamma proteobacterium symbiont of Taylorina sp.]|nr:retroviral-like aspartic protease family protein [gamma proteobacterium symbiont of Taylorina sp.]
MKLISKIIVLFTVLLLLLCAEVNASHKIQVMALFTDKAMLSIDGKQKILKKGQTYRGVKLISSDSRAVVLELHGEIKKFKLGSTVSTNFKKSAADKEFVVWKDPQNMFRINGSINNFSAKFLIDTGASTIALNSIAAKRMGIKYRSGTPLQATTASGVVQGYQVILSKVKIGHIQLYNVYAAVLEGAFPTEVLLGQTFLSRIHMTRDGNKMILKKKY